MFITLLAFIFIMSERVETGGLMSFDYSKSEKPRMSEEQKKEIEEAYEKYYERKRREKRRRFFIIVLIIVIILAGLLAWIL